jgi:hypothetical protein
LDKTLKGLFDVAVLWITFPDFDVNEDAISVVCEQFDICVRHPPAGRGFLHSEDA